MASIRADITRDINPGRIIKGHYSDELWEVWASADDATNRAESNYNESGYVDPNTCLATPGLPELYKNHPILHDALCIDLRVVQVLANWSVIVRARFQAWGLYSGGPRAITSSFGNAKETIVPVYEALPVGTSTFLYQYRPFIWQREHTIRIETRFLPGNQFDAVQTAIARSVGGWYRIPDTNNGDFYLLSGQCSARYDGTSYTRVNYAFETWARFPGAVENDPVLHNAVAIPALSNLEDWQPYRPTPSSRPVINVVPVANYASQGLPLPGFP